MLKLSLYSGTFQRIFGCLGQLSVVESLVEKHGCDPNVRDVDECTPLHLAMLENHKAMAEKLIKSYKCDVNSQKLSQQHCTPPAWPVNFGYEKIVKMLLEHKVNRDIRNNEKDTPLHSAAFHGHCKVIKLLLTEKSCVKEPKGFDGCTPLHYGATTGQLAIVESLVSETRLQCVLCRRRRPDPSPHDCLLRK